MFEIEYKSMHFEYENYTLKHLDANGNSVTIGNEIGSFCVLNEIDTYCENLYKNIKTDMDSIRNTIGYIQNETEASDLMSEIVAELESRYDDLRMQLSEME